MFSPQCHRKRSRGIFLAGGDNVVCVIAEKGKPSAKGTRKNKVQGRFLVALEMTVWGEWITHVPYKGYVGKTPLPQRHPERSRGIFLVYWYSVLCEAAENGKPFAKGSKKQQSARRISRCARNDGMVYIALCEIAENGKPFAKGARNDGVQGRFLDCARNDGRGDGFISRSVQRICLESAIPVTSSRAKSRDLSCTLV